MTKVSSRNATLKSKPPLGRDKPKAATKRMTREQREKLIIDEALKFFAEVGFGGETRELAKRLGIAQPHIYKFFSSKEMIIERVYREVYMGRWNPHWEIVLGDQSMSLWKKLSQFYHEYAQVFLQRDWIRLFLYSGLSGADLNRRYWEVVNERLFKPIVMAMRQEFNLPGGDNPPTTPEIESVWNLHSSIFYMGVRRSVYGLEIPKDLNEAIDQKVTAFIYGAPAMLRALDATSSPPESTLVQPT